MKNEKGFTLIELLAVIVILALVMVIATPKILNVIQNSKLKAFENSANLIVEDALVKQTSGLLNGGSVESTYVFDSNEESGYASGSPRLSFKGEKPSSGELYINSSGKVALAFVSSDREYCATKNFDESEVTVTEYVSGDCGIALDSIQVGEYVTSIMKENFLEGQSVITSSNVRSIVFSNIINQTDNSFDVSKKNDNSVILNYVENGIDSEGNTLYDLTIGSTGGVTIDDMSSLFEGFSELVSVDFNNLNTIKVESMANLFSECTNLTTIVGLDKLNTSNVTNMSNMFYGCVSLTSLVININTTNVIDMSSMFELCTNLATLDISNFNTGKLKTVDAMFWSCSNLETINMSNFDITNITSSDNMFKDTKTGTKIKVKNDTVKNFILNLKNDAVFE